MRSIDWTRLFPRRKGTTDAHRVAYLVEFLRRARGSERNKQKAIKEIHALSKI